MSLVSAPNVMTFEMTVDFSNFVNVQSETFTIMRRKKCEILGGPEKGGPAEERRRGFSCRGRVRQRRVRRRGARGRGSRGGGPAKPRPH